MKLDTQVSEGSRHINCVRDTLHIIICMVICSLDIYAEEHAVMSSSGKQTDYVSNIKPTNDTSLCNPNIPIKAPQVLFYVLYMACHGLLSLMTVYCQSELLLFW